VVLPWGPQEVPLWATLAALVVPPWVPPMVLLVAPLTSVLILRPHASLWHSSRSLAAQVDPQQLGQVDLKVVDQVGALTLEGTPVCCPQQLGACGVFGCTVVTPVDLAVVRAQVSARGEYQHRR
jgi:hypothetical protein